MTTLIEHQVRKNDLRKTRWLEYDSPKLEDGDVLLAVDTFAITANNVTYAVFGEAMQYWNFFPATEDGWGRVPMWGFATVAESKADGVRAGQRVFGYVPASNAFIAKKVSTAGIAFQDNAENRAGLSPFYNTYIFTTDDPAYRSDTEAQQMLFRPLFATGWWLSDKITRHEAGLKSALITSASSKTSLATAWSLNASGANIETIGLTSAENVEFTENTGLYARTVAYDQIPTIDATAPVSLTDMRGSAGIRRAVHTRFADTLAASIAVGATEWNADNSNIDPMPGPEPEFFFVPTYAADRIKDSGPSMTARMNEDMLQFYRDCLSFITPITSKGADAVDLAWQTCLDGKVAPDTGLILVP